MTVPQPDAGPEPPETSLERMVGIFKVLADPMRLRILGLLTERSCCGQDLASRLRISPATVSHHLQLLRQVGLIKETRHAPYTYYEADLATLQGILRSVARREQVQQFAADAELPEEERRVLRIFFEGSRLKSIPAQRRKKVIVFEEILRRLPRRKEYPEKELSRWLGSIHPDFCTLRREFVVGDYMERQAGIYRLTEKGRAVTSSRRRSHA